MFQLINLMAVSSHTHKPTLNDFCVVLSRSIHQSNEFEFKIIAWRKLLRNGKPCQPRHAQGNSIITRCRRAFFYSVIHKQLARYSKVWSVLHQLHLSQKSRQSAQVLFCPSKWMSSPLFVPRSVVLEAGRATLRSFPTKLFRLSNSTLKHRYASEKATEQLYNFSLLAGAANEDVNSNINDSLWGVFVNTWLFRVSEILRYKLRKFLCISKTSIKFTFESSLFHTTIIDS